MLREKVRVRAVPFTWPVLALAVLLAVALLATGGRYGYYGDELYFWAAGQHLDWSYADQPPLTPLVARMMDLIAPGSLVVMRLPAIACAVAGVLFAAVTAREMGGSPRAELLTAAAVATSPVLAAGGHVLATTPIDTFLWIVISWLLARWIRLRSDRLLMWIGLVTGVALLNKYMIVFFWLVAGLAILLVGPRELLRRKHFWLGAVVAMLMSAPALLWQASHRWPQLAMSGVVGAEQDPGNGGVTGFLLLLLGSAGLLGIPLLGYGLWRAFRTPSYRFFACTFVGLVVVLGLAFGHGYYLTGTFTALWAVGAVGLDGVRRWLPWVAWPAALLSAAMVLALLPIRPIESLAADTASSNPVGVESVGWPELADTVAAAYRELPAAARSHTGILASTYWAAGALARYGPSRGLPSVHSPHRGFWYFGPPPADVTSVLYVGDTSSHLGQYFADVRQVATVDNGLMVPNSTQGAPVWFCTGSHDSWSVVWPRLRNL
jgi:4-amino-4-deoxy-L-arabinose transferase-like glycosyltransferase